MKATVFNKIINDLSIVTSRDGLMSLENRYKTFGGVYKVNTQNTMGQLNAR
jgi:hypothetical protein